jgi:hypothetical protein
MISPFLRSIVTALLPAGLTFAITAAGAHAQQSGPAQRQYGIAGQRAAPNATIQMRQVGSQTGASLGQSTTALLSGTLTPALLQAELQLLIAQDQQLLQQLRNGQITLPASSSVTSSQLQASLQQQITLLQSLLQLVQNGQATVQPSSSTLDPTAARRPQAVRAGQTVTSGTSRARSGR